MRSAAPDACRHPLHDEGRDWPETNCNLDLWIEYLHSRKLPPEAALGALVAIDDEGDQFTFCRLDPGDLWAMFGIDVQELAIFDRLDRHIAAQTGRGRLVMVEVDSFHLPDTRATAYRQTHGKTTIGIDWIDAAAARLGYFHNAGHFYLAGEDYAALIGADPDTTRLFPYCERVRTVRPPLEAAALRRAALDALGAHLARAPQRNPFRAYQQRFAADLGALAPRSPDFFHLYAFNHFRQFGSVFGLLGAFARWLGGAEALASRCDALAAAAKLLQFRAARTAARGRPDPAEAIFDSLATHWEAALAEFSARAR